MGSHQSEERMLGTGHWALELDFMYSVCSVWDWFVLDWAVLGLTWLMNMSIRNRYRE